MDNAVDRFGRDRTVIAVEDRFAVACGENIILHVFQPRERFRAFVVCKYGIVRNATSHQRVVECHLFRGQPLDKAVSKQFIFTVGIDPKIISA